MTNALLSPNMTTTLKALKKRNNSLSLVNKFHTLNSSSGLIPDPLMLNQTGEILEKPVPQVDKEAEQIFYKGVKCLDSNDPKKAINYFTQIVDRTFTNKRMVYIMLSIAYR